MSGATEKGAAQFQHLTLIGCGKMGSALMQRWSDLYGSGPFTIIEPGPVPADLKNVAHFKEPEAARRDLQKSKIIVVAVKPQIMDDVCTSLRPFINHDSLVISIAAGKTITNIAAKFSAAQPIIRVMPNTPAAIGKGVSVCCANAHVSNTQKHWAQDLITPAGLCEWLDDEAMMDAVTALSGSGPAYVFHVIEMLAKAGEKLGFKPDFAMTLARQTVIGSAALAEVSAQTPVSTLRENVTSPGGTTAAGLSVLMDGRAQKIFDDTLKAAEKRGQELNK